ncbi:phosphatidylinositol-binding clathrin assembly protein-like, partial [Brachyhypopomus gauderio]|uniref:phosphatidylinositol-binding clathrin assembly protein-like n=1 Tax=Brachyhypopomus gauderio TaxID=698409 RepID=UPI0040413C0C
HFCFSLQEQRLKELSKKPSTSSTTAASPVSTASGSISTAPAIDLFSTPSSINSTSKVPSDLLDLQPVFQPALTLPTAPGSSSWGDAFCSSAPFSNTPLFCSEPSALAGLFAGFSPASTPLPAGSSGLNVDFDSVFGNKSAGAGPDAADDGLGGILKPTVASPNQCLPPSSQQPGKLVSDDLESSLANLVGNLGIGNGTAKNDIHWSQPGEKKLTGGNNWQPKSAPTTTWNPATMSGMLFPQYAPSVMAFPATTPTGMMGYAVQPQMTPVAVMTQPTMMYTQPVMRPANPFGPVSGAQPSTASSPSSQSPLRPTGQDPFAQLSLKDFL